MQFSIQTLVALAVIPVLALAQVDPGPSPTASVGCEPHGDHWHCDGAKPTDALVQSSSAVAAPGTISTTTSTRVITTTTSAAITSKSSAVEHDHEGEDHDEDETAHASGTGKLGPSPTNSVGCKAHGDHWDCEGPIAASTTASVLTSVAAIRTISNTTAVPTAVLTSASRTSTNAQSLGPTGGAVALSAGVIGGFLGLVGAFALQRP